MSTAAEQVMLFFPARYVKFHPLVTWQWAQVSCVQGFGRVGGSGTGLSGSGTGQRGIDQSLGSHVPHGQNVGSAGGQVLASPQHIVLPALLISQLLLCHAETTASCCVSASFCPAPKLLGVCGCVGLWACGATFEWTARLPVFWWHPPCL